MITCTTIYSMTLRYEQMAMIEGLPETAEYQIDAPEHKVSVWEYKADSLATAAGPVSIEEGQEMWRSVSENQGQVTIRYQYTQRVSDGALLAVKIFGFTLLGGIIFLLLYYVVKFFIFIAKNSKAQDEESAEQT